jgi:uncharacterized protein (DUF1330 family)
MKMKTRLAIGVVSGLVIGAVGVQAIHAQMPSRTGGPAFYIAELEVTDPEALKPYREQVDATFAPFSGRYVVRGGEIASLEGEAPKGRIVVIKFDNMEKAKAWYDSPAYREIRPIRHRAAKSRVYIVEGTAERETR